MVNSKRFILLVTALSLLCSSCSNRVEGAANGASVGSIVGGLLGHIIGGYHGEDVGTLVGIAAGGVAGHAIGSAQERKAERRWQKRRSAPQEDMPQVYESIPRKHPGYTIEPMSSKPAPLTIAHRGEWKSQGSAENSRTSLERALEMGIWGTEIDVWLTRDNHVMINHDATYQGVSIQDTTYKACKRLRLDNGEKMPELYQLLNILRKSDSPTVLVLEVKPHRDPQRSRDCATAAVEAVRKAGQLERTMWISFSIEACQTICQLLPNAEVAYLNGDRAPHELYPMGINGIDYNIKHLRENPEWVDEAHRLHMSVNVWTVDDPKEMREMRDLGVDFITTNEPARCEQLFRR
jgi:glycerophosphoryl diester phosphodiesterase